MYRDKRQHQSNDAFKQRLQHRLPHDEHRKIGPESHVEAQRGSSDSQMLAELRMRGSGSCEGSQRTFVRLGLLLVQLHMLLACCSIALMLQWEVTAGSRIRVVLLAM